MEFLVRSFSDHRGYSVHRGKLDRTRQKSYVPWAVTMQGKVVYAEFGAHRERPKGLLRPYDGTVSKQRRTACESALGMLALRNPQFASGAVKAVSKGLVEYITARQRENPEKTIDVVHALSKYFYSDTSFARLGGRNQAPGNGIVAKRRFFQFLLAQLQDAPLPVILNIQDQMGRVGSRELGGPQQKKWADLNKILRPAYLFNAANRGRVDRADRNNPDPTYNRTATRTAGIMPTGTGQGLGQTFQARERGADRFKRDADSNHNAYYYDLDDQHLTFGAGPSGTTGTLLTTGMVFGGLAGDRLKQYLFGIIGYLVGGGMHSVHESFTVAALCPDMHYQQGSFTQMLPKPFLQSHAYRQWWAEYYDIAELGATHWRHGTADPSMAFRAPRMAT